MKKLKNSWIFVLVIIITIVLFSLKGNLHNNRKTLNSINPNDYKNIDNLVIVAHPDDETLWAFNFLYKNNCLVVCITCGSNKIREKEIEKVVKSTNDKLISLGYTDKFLNHRSKWKFSYKNIKYDLDTIINLKKWDAIITHNKDGEYGHIHHKMIHNIVEEHKNKQIKYFGKYYSKNKIKKVDSNNIKKYKLEDNIIEKKEKTLEIYKSQKKVRKMFKHMIPYENIGL